MCSLMEMIKPVERKVLNIIRLAQEDTVPIDPVSVKKMNAKIAAAAAEAEAAAEEAAKSKKK
jgi:hypothetical protein